MQLYCNCNTVYIAFFFGRGKNRELLHSRGHTLLSQICWRSIVSAVIAAWSAAFISFIDSSSTPGYLFPAISRSFTYFAFHYRWFLCVRFFADLCVSLCILFVGLFCVFHLLIVLSSSMQSIRVLLCIEPVFIFGCPVISVNMGLLFYLCYCALPAPCNFLSNISPCLS
jgi:hypothetical protein